jgi:uncharacterized protein (TIGR00251 family)
MRLHIKVKPNSREDEVALEPDGAISVRIKAPPVDGKANKYLMVFLAEYFGLPRSRVRLLKGETNQFKVIEIDAEETDIKRKLEQAQKDI